MKIKEYLNEVKSEMRKVSWPSKQRTIKDSTIVVVASLATAAFLGAADSVFNFVTESIIVK